MTFEPEDILNSLSQTESRVSSRRISSKAKSLEKIPPTILWNEGFIVVPSTFKDKRSYAGHCIMKFATHLGLTVKLTGYDGEMRVPSEYDENIALGIYMGLTDQNANFNIKAKTDAYELGRTIVRAQQIIGCLTSLGHSVDILKPNHYFFANNPGEVKKIDKNTVSVSSCKTQLVGLFAEKEIASDLLDMLIKLLRASYRLIPEDTLYNDLKPNIVTYQQVITKYCSVDRVIEPAKGKRKALIAKKVPGKPKLSPLLLKSEMDFLSKISSPLFGKTTFEEMSLDEWVNNLLDVGIAKVRGHLKSIYNERQVYLTRFAKLTTTRLQAIRKMDPTKSSIKKASVVVTDVQSLLLTRADLTTTFVSEVQKLDPTGEVFIAQYFAGDTKNYVTKGQLSDDDIRQLISKMILDNQVYSELKNDLQATQSDWVRRAVEAETALRITKKEFDNLRSKLAQTSRRRKFEALPEDTLWQLIESRAKVTLPRAVGNQRKKIPSSNKKSYKEYVHPDNARKGKSIQIEEPVQEPLREIHIKPQSEDSGSEDEGEYREPEQGWVLTDVQQAILTKQAHRANMSSVVEYLNSDAGKAEYARMRAQLG
jgi:hypothetical protein